MTVRRMASLGIGLALAASLTPGPASAAANKVTIGDNFFQPKRITINAGERVKWINNGAETHTTTSKKGLWDKTVPPGETAGKKFKKEGTYRYLCTIHDDMRGKVIVV